MRKQPYPITKLVGGANVAYDPFFITDTESANLQSIRFDKGLVKKALGWSILSNDALSGPIMMIAEFSMYDGTTHTVVASNLNVYNYDAANANFINRNSNANFTGNESDRFNYVITYDANGNDLFVFTNGVEDIQKWDGSANDCANLDGWANTAKAKFLVSFQSRLCAARTTEGGQACPTRVRWSVAGDPEDIANTGSGFVELVETPGWITSSVILKGKWFIIKEDSIWEMVYVGGTTVFVPVLRIPVIGSFVEVVNLGEQLMIVASDNVYLFDGLSLAPIGNNIRPWLYEVDNMLVNASALNRMVGTYFKDTQITQLNFPTSGANPDLELSFDHKYNAWLKRPREYTAVGPYTEDIAPTWSSGAANATWANLANDVPWLSRSVVSGAPLTWYGTKDGYIYVDDRLTKSSDSMLFETKDFIFEHASRIVECRVQAKGGPFTIAYSLNKGVTWSAPVTMAVSTSWTEYSMPLNLTTQLIRFKIESSAEDIDIKWIEPWYIPRTRSLPLTFPS